VPPTHTEVVVGGSVVVGEGDSDVGATVTVTMAVGFEEAALVFEV
jgi:hypothetical protein